MFERIRYQLEISPAFQKLLSSVKTSTSGKCISVRNLSGSSLGFVLSQLCDCLKCQLVVVNAERSQAEEVFDDLGLLRAEGSVRLLNWKPDRFNSIHDTLQIPQLTSTLQSIANGSAEIVVTSSFAVVAHLPVPSALKRRNITVAVGSEHPMVDLLQRLNAVGLEEKDFVGEPGEYSHRGGILDVFSFSGEFPIRLEFFGDTVESIREFDPVSQRSIREISIGNIAPNLFAKDAEQPPASETCSLFNYLDQRAIVVLINPEVILKSIQGAGEPITEGRIPADTFNERLSRFVQINVEAFARNKDTIEFNISSQPSFNGNISLLRDHVLDLLKSHVHVIFSCDGHAEQKRLRELVVEAAQSRVDESAVSEADMKQLRTVEFVPHAIHSGFLLHDEAIACYSEHQIFGRQMRRARTPKARSRGFSQRDIQQLRKGDFVVHEDFGIGRFDGLKKIRVRNVEQEVIKLLYEEKDTLYINLNYLNRIQKYSSKDGHIPKLTRLGTPEWERLKTRAKKRIQDIARDLIRLYARRKSSSGYAFHPDTPWQKELEASFMYEDTFDQAKATLDVKRDMQQQFPMDRLICGDVGFGKTEVAVRAAFKAVLDGKQAGVLVPTTILAIQHFNTFVDRTSRFSVKVAVISRLKSKKEQLIILDQLKTGSIDIIIGTHRLLSKDVQFKDLGLLIIDEEHRFGVAAKEKLRHIRANVDTLTLTATPIPRTLHFSLMGARDLSLITTPPRNRLPIITEITQFGNDVVKEVVTREIARGGQVYCVHDRVQDIDEWTNKLRVLLPSLRISYAHGQMHAHQLESVMLDFQERKLDVLVCTKIIESGLDIPNVNTIIINRADRFGMSELYQLKGRVGRSNVQAYAYLIVPPASVLPRTAIQRLQAVEEFTELGSGFNLAMRDLEIRGAGNLLGAEQSGFIESMGFETYTRILDNAVSELKEQEFMKLFPQQKSPKQESSETLIEVELDALIPDTYVHNDTERLEIYRRMYALSTNEQLQDFGVELEDRFGKHPHQVTNLLNTVRVRLTASAFGFRKVLMGKQSIEFEFPPESETEFYEGTEFQKLMTEIVHWKNRGVHFKQDEKVLRLVLKIPDTTPSADPIGVTLKFLIEIQNRIKPNPSPASQPELQSG